MDASLSSNRRRDAVFFGGAGEIARISTCLRRRNYCSSRWTADPQFAQAHSALAQAWDALGFESKAADEAKKALDAASESFQRGEDTRERATLRGETRLDESDSGVCAALDGISRRARIRPAARYTQIRAGKIEGRSDHDQSTAGQGSRARRSRTGGSSGSAAHGDLDDYKDELASATSAARGAKARRADLLARASGFRNAIVQLRLGEAGCGDAALRGGRKNQSSFGRPVGGGARIERHCDGVLLRGKRCGRRAAAIGGVEYRADHRRRVRRGGRAE